MKQSSTCGILRDYEAACRATSTEQGARIATLAETEPSMNRSRPYLALIQAAEGKADLILVGSQGRSALDDLVMGSVSKKVLRHAACSVPTEFHQIPKIGTIILR